MKIVLITSGQPSVNPRLVKEADAFSGAGYDVTVLYAYWNEWATRFDQEWLKTKKWKAIQVGGSPHTGKLRYLFSRVVHKVACYLWFVWPTFFADTAIARSAFFLKRKVRVYPADLYIGHNLGALGAVVKAAKLHCAKCGFDAEDFHRHEIDNNTGSIHYKICKRIEDKYIPQLDYLSTSSELISAEYEKLYPQSHPITFKNVFPANGPEVMKSFSPTLKLFWFSQTIGPNRGLEDVIEAIAFLKNKNIELHLLGYLPVTGRVEYLEPLLKKFKINVIIHEPVPANQLTRFAAQFDIGLALEPGFSLNNELALSNKIFTYMQAGLAIIASDTLAQSKLINEYSGIGKLYRRKDAHGLAAILQSILADRNGLVEMQREAKAIAETELNWEKEGSRFLKLVKSLLQTQ